MDVAKAHQRIGVISNAHAGRDFENAAYQFFAAQGIVLKSNHRVMLGVSKQKKAHAFDLGCEEQKFLVECKSHRWTSTSNIPSAKLTVWNEAMYYFSLAPKEYRKAMFVLRDECAKRSETLATYYLRNYGHLIPEDVEVWEYDERTRKALCVRRSTKCSDDFIGSDVRPAMPQALADEDGDEEVGDNLDATLIDAAMSPSAPSFQFVLRKTYFENGFFNVTVDSQHLFPEQGGSLDIYCGPERQLIKGRFDRTANKGNGTPRVHGYTTLRDWFQRNYEPMQSVTVTVLGPSAIEIDRT